MGTSTNRKKTAAEISRERTTADKAVIVVQVVVVVLMTLIILGMLIPAPHTLR